MDLVNIILGLFVGFWLGVIVISILKAGTVYDNELLLTYIQKLKEELKDEEENNKLLREANESLKEDYLKLKEKYDQNYIQLDALKAKCNKFSDWRFKMKNIKNFVNKMKKSFQSERKRLSGIVKRDEQDCKFLEIPFEVEKTTCLAVYDITLRSFIKLQALISPEVTFEVKLDT